MDNKKTNTNVEKKELVVNTSNCKGSLYSQMVGISVSGFEATLEFVYINPNIKTSGEVISRITLPIDVAKSLAEKINSTIVLHEQKIAKKA